MPLYNYMGLLIDVPLVIHLLVLETELPKDFPESNAPINVSPYLPPPGARWGIFLVWKSRLASGVGILNR